MASYIPRPTPLPVGREIKEHYTAREAFEATLWELNKVSAPSIPVDEFNHFWNAGKDNYYKERYNLYDANQQTTDDMRDLSATYLASAGGSPALDVAAETVELPEDYYHLLSATAFWQVTAKFRTHNVGDVVDFAVERASADRLSMLRQDYYNRPSYRKPYFLLRQDFLEVHAGKHQNVVLQQVEITYLMKPEHIELKHSDLDDLTTDPSQVFKESAIVTREVLKWVVKLVLENQGNPRTPGKAAVDQAVPNQLPPPPAQAGRR